MGEAGMQCEDQVLYECSITRWCDLMQLSSYCYLHDFLRTALCGVPPIMLCAYLGKPKHY